MASAGGVLSRQRCALRRDVPSRVDGVGLSLAHGAALSGRGRRDSAREIKVLACDAAAHRAMLIVGRFFTGRRARQRTACFGTSGLALRSSANIASTDRPACLIASAAYCRVCYSTALASLASHGADGTAAISSSSRHLKVVRCCAGVSAFEPWPDASLDDSGQPMLPEKMAARAMQF